MRRSNDMALTLLQLHPEVADATLDVDELRCSICLELLTIPTRGACEHYFCCGCILGVVNSSRLQSGMTEIDCPHRDTSAIDGSGVPCPLCRQDLGPIKRDTEEVWPLIASLQVTCPLKANGCTFVGDGPELQHHLRQCPHVLAAQIWEQNRRLSLKAKTLEVFAGNTYRFRSHVRSPSKHGWTAYVHAAPSPRGRGAPRMQSIAKVEFILWSGRRVEVTRHPFRVTRNGWGTFDVFAEVTMASGVRHRISIPLNFDQPRTERRVPLVEDSPSAEWQDADVAMRGSDY